jgi:hypothetical protein
METRQSSIDRVKAHIAVHGCDTPAEGETYEALQTIVRRYDEVRSLGREFGSVELSPYVSALLQVSRLRGETATGVHTAVAAGV